MIYERFGVSPRFMLSKQLENQLLEIFLEYVKPSNLHKGM